MIDTEIAGVSAITPVAAGSCDCVPLPPASPTALLAAHCCAGSPAAASGAVSIARFILFLYYKIWVYFSLGNLIYSCQLRLHHASIREEVWLLNVHEIHIGFIRFFTHHTDFGFCTHHTDFGFIRFFFYTKYRFWVHQIFHSSSQWSDVVPDNVCWHLRIS